MEGSGVYSTLYLACWRSAGRTLLLSSTTDQRLLAQIYSSAKIAKSLYFSFLVLSEQPQQQQNS
jgi:hypothetical protein